MIIRSQDKTIITTNLNLWISKEVVGFEIENADFKLGKYLTEEKAIKVLDMIEDACKNMAFTDGVVFHMPQDSEVEV